MTQSPPARVLSRLADEMDTYVKAAKQGDADETLALEQISHFAFVIHESLRSLPEAGSVAVPREAGQIVTYAITLMEVEGNYDKALQYLRAVQDRLSAAPVAREGWIDTGDHLPNPHADGEYIVACRSGYVTVLHFDDSGWRGDDALGSADFGYWNQHVTHWQPLPTAPAGSGEGK